MAKRQRHAVLTPFTVSGKLTPKEEAAFTDLFNNGVPSFREHLADQGTYGEGLFDPIDTSAAESG